MNRDQITDFGKLYISTKTIVIFIANRLVFANFIHNYSSLFWAEEMVKCILILISFKLSEPPLRLIDDQGREISDRYYKVGSTIDLYCQVSRNFLIKENIQITKSLQLYEQNQTKRNPNKSQIGANRLGSGYNELVSRSNHSNAKMSSLALEKQFSNMIFWTKDDEILPFTAIKRSR